MKAEFCRALCMRRLPGILTKGYHIFSSQMDYEGRVLSSFVYEAFTRHFNERISYIFKPNGL